MSRPRPIEEVTIELSYRMHDCAGPCAYVVAVTTRTDGTRQVLDSRHFSGDPLRTVDNALEMAKQLTLEHFLPLTSPF